MSPSERSFTSPGKGAPVEALANLPRIPPFPVAANGSTADRDSPRLLQVVIETPRGSRIKYKFDEELRAFTLKSLLPAGMVFPYNFGFVPRTLGGDGDPLDVLVLLEEPLFPGCVLAVRPVGVMEVEQIVNGATQRNDRLLAVTETADPYGAWRDLEDLPKPLLRQLDEFFTQYHRLGGKSSRTLACHGAATAYRLVDEAVAKAAADSR